MNARIILPLVGMIAGWLLFEEMILGAVIFALVGLGFWARHHKKSKKSAIKKTGVFW